MNDLIPIAVFALCLIVTFGLVRVCEWLKPRDSGRAERASGTNSQELRS
jgi:hypothetical protein